MNAAKRKTTYLTTPLYYVNASPHIGHAYANLAADTYARFHRLLGEDVFFLTGTDEHGQKIERSAAAAGMSPQAFADSVVARFQSLWKLLNISHDDYIRTTQPRHVERVQEILRRLHKAGRLIQAAYKGWYCTPDETFWTEGEIGGPTGDPTAVDPQSGKPLCPTCGRPLEPVEEVGWHLKLRDHQEWLKQYLKDNHRFIRPQTRYNEIASLLEQPLPETWCIARPRHRVGWGIEVPFDPGCVVYVWFDALLNYITVPWEIREKEKRTLWPASLHLIGKDILRHHTVYWPVVLRELAGLVPELGYDRDVPLPDMVFAHGLWKVGEQKMSKSLGNVVDPVTLITERLASQPFAADVFRYYVLSEIPFGQDGFFSEEGLQTRLTTDLGNDLGNLVNRTLSMIDRYCGGKIPPSRQEDLDAIGLRGLGDRVRALPESVRAAMEDLQFSLALNAIMQVVTLANQSIEQAAPWQLAKQPEKRAQLEGVLGALACTVRIVGVMLKPFMPAVSDEIRRQLACGDAAPTWEDAAHWEGRNAGATLIRDRAVLFPRPAPAAGQGK